MQGGGRAQAVSIISPIYRVWAWWLRGSWVVADRSAFIKKPLLDLKFIHFAHFSLVTRMPQKGNWMRRKRLTYPYILFQSNFNDDLNAYIDAFATAVPGHVMGVWGGVRRFPGPKPVDRFIGFVLPRVSKDYCYYSAYPEYSATMITDGLRLRESLRAFEAASSRNEADGKFMKRVREFLAANQQYL